MMLKAATLRNRPDLAAMLVCLLLFWQWAGFWMVLCVSGPEHIQLEMAGASCCGNHGSDGQRLSGDNDECFGCSDVGVPGASHGSFQRHDPSHILAVAAVLPSMDGLTPPDFVAAPGVALAGESPGLASPALAPLRC